MMPKEPNRFPVSDEDRADEKMKDTAYTILGVIMAAGAVISVDPHIISHFHENRAMLITMGKCTLAAGAVVGLGYLACKTLKH